MEMDRKHVGPGPHVTCVILAYMYTPGLLHLSIYSKHQCWEKYRTLLLSDIFLLSITYILYADLLCVMNELIKYTITS